MAIPMFFYEACGVGIPLCLGFIIDSLTQKDAQSVYLLSGGVFLLMIIRVFLHRKYMVEREYVKGYNESALNGFITEGLYEKSIGQHTKFKKELSQSSMNRARMSIRFLTSLMLFEGITSSYGLLISFCFIWFIAPVAGAILTLALIVYLLGSLFLNKRVVDEYTPIDDSFKNYNDKLEESWDKSIRILSLGKGSDVAKILHSQYEEVNNRSRAFWISFINDIAFKDLANVFALMLVFGYYIYTNLHGSGDSAKSVGFLFPLFSWSWNVVNNIWRIGHIEHEFNWNLPMVRKLKDALDIKPDIFDNDPKILAFSETPAISFENVTFNHVKENTNKATIRDLSFTINPGEKVALIGSSGAGKTTLAKLLQRAYDPHGGRIVVNNHNLKDVSLEAWRSVLGEIPQDIEIFEGTLRDNLLAAVHSDQHHLYTDEILQKTMDRFVIDFCKEEGLDTKIGPEGVDLSGGQKQRVAIAQIALKNESCVYIIDEATSSLDNSTEKIVHDGFVDLLDGNASALVVAHKLSTVRDLCNKFIILRKLHDTPEGESQIEAQGGSFEEIFDQSPTLQRLMAEGGLSLKENPLTA